MRDVFSWLLPRRRCVGNLPLDQLFGLGEQSLGVGVGCPRAGRAVGGGLHEGLGAGEGFAGTGAVLLGCERNFERGVGFYVDNASGGEFGLALDLDAGEALLDRGDGFVGDFGA